MLLANDRSLKIFNEAQNEIINIEKSYYSEQSIKELQQKKILSILDRAKNNDYYNKAIDNIDVDSFFNLSITPKNAPKDNPESFIADDSSKILKYYETSGTTGVPTPAVRSAEDIIWNTISVANIWKNTIGDTDKVASLLPSDISPIGDLISYVCEYLDIPLVRSYPFAMGICDWNRVESMFERYKPTCIFASPGIVMQYMRLLKQKGSFESIKSSVNTIMLLGEINTQGLRNMIGEEWGAKVFNASYGSTETGTIAATCEKGHLHSLLYSAYLELFDGQKVIPFLPGRTAELIVTPLNNYMRPMLRYSMGDIVEVSDEECSCGLKLPVLTIKGRTSEGLAINGNRLNAEQIENIIYSVKGVTGYMVEMYESGDPGRLLLEKDVDFNLNLVNSDKIITNFHNLGVTWEDIVYVNQLPAITKSGAGQKNWKKTNVRLVHN